MEARDGGKVGKKTLKSEQLPVTNGASQFAPPKKLFYHKYRQEFCTFSLADNTIPRYTIAYV